jgi:ADP-heptose:LPS heptosyltransferase/glycosyltransferase involved in cell wall biosynthesis
MKRVLFVGESPIGCTGNSNFMRAILNQVDKKEYGAACFAVGTTHILQHDIFQPHPVPIISADGSQDKWNGKKLLRVIHENPIEAVIFIGIDIWVYAPIFDELMDLKRSKNFKFITICPYDTPEIRKDWIHWFRQPDISCIYSEFGYNLIKKEVPNARYFRPPLFADKLFQRLSPEKRAEARHKYFPTIGEGFLFGYLGNNQVRKDPQKAILAYSEVKKNFEDAYLYMHLNMGSGVYNLVQFAMDCGLKSGDMIAKSGDPDAWVSLPGMVEIYNCFDALLNCSLQEGLSWTLLEAMLCGVPIIASDTTAQTELVKDVGTLVPCNEPAYIPVYAERGQSWISAKCCAQDDLKHAMINMMESKPYREQCRNRGFEKVRSWMQGVHNINDVLKDAFADRTVHKTSDVPYGMKDALCFAQKSSAGDILMTTKALKGLRNMFPGKELHYMTQRQYVDIVRGNPHVDKVLAWDEVEYNTYVHRLNPHQERVLPGHWGRNCNTLLSDFYWKLLMVDAEPAFIEKKRPQEKIASQVLEMMEQMPICVLHTTGGDPAFRTYKYMAEVGIVLSEQYTTIQLGGQHDYDAKADIDLRGKLSFRESAWVMEKAVLSINVDSFISHLAGCIGVSQIVLFGSGNAFVVRPDQTKGELVCMVPDYIMDCPGLGPCSASIRNCPVPCTGIHDPQSILDEVFRLEQENKIKRSTENEEGSHRFEYVQRDRAVAGVVQELQASR